MNKLKKVFDKKPRFAIVWAMTITQLTNRPQGQELQAPLHESVAANNSVAAGCNIHSLFRGAWIDTESGMHGCRWLIHRIMTEAKAYFPLYNGSSEDRPYYVAYAMTTAEITAKVRKVNGFDKYPDKTILDVLSTVMQRSGQVARIQLTNKEDQSRSCRRPRVAWYLVCPVKTPVQA